MSNAPYQIQHRCQREACAIGAFKRLRRSNAWWKGRSLCYGSSLGCSASRVCSVTHIDFH